MALAIDASTPAQATVANAISVTTASFTPPLGALLVVKVACNEPDNADSTFTSVTASTGVSSGFTRRVKKNTSASSTGGAGVEGGAEIWTGVVTTSTAMTITATGLDPSGAGSGYDKGLFVEVWTGADTTDLSNVVAASSTSGLPSVTLSSTVATSYGSAVSSDWSAGGLGTVGSGQTEELDYNNSSQVSLHGWRTTAAIGGSSQTMDLTAPSGQRYNIVALEVKEAASGPTQHINPDADTVITGWTDQSGGTTNIYQTIDESSASDSDYIKATTP